MSGAVGVALEPVESVPGPIAEPTDEDRIDVLADAVVRALFAGNGRSARCDTRAELEARLVEDGVTYTDPDLGLALARLEDCGRVMRPLERLTPGGQPSPGRPFILGGMHVYNHIDRLAASVVEFLRTSDHGERSDSVELLAEQMQAAGVEFDEGDLDRAVMWLEQGRILLRPQPDHPLDPVPWVLR